jgi:precorrin-3B synthase
MPPLGRLDPETADAVADAVAAHGTGEVRLTPWRSIVVPGATAGALAAAGLLTDPTDPATAVVACAGATGCTAGLTDAPADALAVARARTTPLAVHVSGCAKRCAHPAPAARTLVAVAPGRYDVLGPDDRPLASGLGVAAAVALVS